jgi:hypothetical protein
MRGWLLAGLRRQPGPMVGTLAAARDRGHAHHRGVRRRRNALAVAGRPAGRRRRRGGGRRHAAPGHHRLRQLSLDADRAACGLPGRARSARDPPGPCAGGRRQVQLLARIGATTRQLASAFRWQALFVTVVGIAAGAAVCAGTLIGLDRAVTGTAVLYIPAAPAALVVTAVAALTFATIITSFAAISAAPLSAERPQRNRRSGPAPARLRLRFHRDGYGWLKRHDHDDRRRWLPPWRGNRFGLGRAPAHGRRWTRGPRHAYLTGNSPPDTSRSLRTCRRRLSWPTIARPRPCLRRISAATADFPDAELPWITISLVGPSRPV